MVRLRCLILAGALVPVLSAEPIQFDEALITQVVNEVEVIDEATLRKSSARINETFAAPDILQTGRRSRAQMTADDGTIFRVGSNSVFSFDPASRDMNLQKGSLLFNTPTGKGGGRVVTASASASVLGTTIIVVATSDGGFKVLCVEGSARVTYNDGGIVDLTPGQLTFVMAGGVSGPVLNYDLDRQTKGSQLINGFQQALPSVEAIESAVNRQTEKIQDGEFSQTGQLLIDAQDTDTLRTLDASVLSIATNPLDNGSLHLNDRGNARLERALMTDVTVTNDNPFPAENLFPEVVTITAEDDPFLSFRALGLGSEIYRGVIARNIEFDATEVDFASFPTASVAGPSGIPPDFVDYAAAESINFNRSGHTFIQGANGSENLYFTARNINFQASEGTEFVFTSDYPNNQNRGVSVFFTSENSFVAAEDVSFNLEGTSEDDYFFFASSTAGNVEFRNGSGVFNSSGVTTLFSQTGDVVIEDSTMVGGSGVSMTGANVSLADTVISASSVSLNASGSSVDISGGSLEAFEVSAFASERLSMANTTLDLASISLAARTVTLQDVDFPSGSTVSLSSSLGLLAPNPNTLAPVRTGMVNFIQNVTYGEVPAQDFVPISVGGNAPIGSERIFINTFNP